MALARRAREGPLEQDPALQRVRQVRGERRGQVGLGAGPVLLGRFHGCSVLAQHCRILLFDRFREGIDGVVVPARFVRREGKASHLGDGVIDRSHAWCCLFTTIDATKRCRGAVMLECKLQRPNRER